MAIPSILMDHDAAAKLFPKADGAANGLAALESALTTGDKPKPQSRPLQRKIRLHVGLDRTPLMGRNLLAVVPGKGELAKEAILVSSHHDHLGTDLELIKAGKIHTDSLTVTGKTIGETLYYGLVSPADSLIAPTSPVYPLLEQRGLARYPFDLQRAQSLPKVVAKALKRLLLWRVIPGQELLGQPHRAQGQRGEFRGPAALDLDQLEASPAQFQHGLPASFLFWQTGSLKIDDSPVEMVAQLAVQAALQLLAAEPVR